METEAFVLDERKSVDIYRQSLALARSYCPEWAKKWQKDFDPDDPGLVMLKLFSKMTEHLLIQLNRIPEKHRIAFLDFMGVDPLSAQPAKVPVTFYLAEGALAAYVPKGALVASKEPEVIFETMKGLNVAPAKLGAVFTLDPLNDSYIDNSRDVKDKKEDVFSIFGDKDELNLDHVLYIGDDTIFDIRRPHEKLEIKFTGSNLSKKYFNQFYYDTDKLLEHIEFLEDIEESGNNSSITAKINNKIQKLQRLTLDMDNSFWLYVKPEGNLKFLHPFYWDEILEKDEKRFKEFISYTNGPGWINESIIEKINDNKIKIACATDASKYILISKENDKVKVEHGEQGYDWKPAFTEKTEGGRLKLEPRIPKLTSITVDVRVTNILPEMSFFNNMPVDAKKGFYPFGESPKAGDALYIGSDEAFSKKGSTIKLMLEYEYKKALQTDNIDAKLNWEYWDGTKWSLMGKSDKSNQYFESYPYKENNASININFIDETKAFTLIYSNTSPAIYFTCPPVEKTEINGQPNRWIRVRIESGGYGEEGKFEPVPEEIDTIIANIKAEEYDLEYLEQILIDKFNLDKYLIEKIFTYLSLEKKDRLTEFKTRLDKSVPEMEKVEKIIDSLELSDKLKQFSEKLRDSDFNDKIIQKIIDFLELEESDNKKQIKDKLEARKSTLKEIENIIDLLESKKLDVLEEVKKKLKEKYNFGFQYKGPTLNPPFIKSLNLEYKYDTKEISRIKTYNNFKFDSIPEKPFEPYLLHPDKTQSMYLGFENQKIGGTSLSLYFAIKEQLYGQKNDKSTNMSGLTDGDKGFKWGYYDGNKDNQWKEFNVDDETHAFTIGGIVSFQVPPDIKTTDVFKNNLLWIKIIPENEKQPVFPELKGISPNTMWAVNNTTVNDEILGSGNGIPNLSLSFSKKPILEGQIIEVNEAGILSEDEKKVIETEESKDSIRDVKDTKTGEIKEVWVRWHEVKNFSHSVHLSRHYILDRLNGKIYFGNGVNGMVPPKGKNNIVARKYKSGGGKAGNLAPGKITVLKRKLPNIESVTNYVSSSGGRDQENLPAAVSRGPHSIKNRNRAVTKEDYEWLAYEASQDVAKAKCILQPSRKINIIIVPDGGEEAPSPDAGLIDTVEIYLKERALFNITGDRIEVMGPEYETIDIDLSAKIVGDFAGEASIIKEKIKDRLRTFLHPLKGGQNKEGWDFGQGIFISEVATAVEAMEGVDYIKEIKLKKKEEDQTYIFDQSNFQEKDKQKIRKFLGDDLDISWAVNADIIIHQSDVHITKGEKSIQIVPDNETLKVSISDGREYTLQFLTEESNRKSIRIAVTGVGYLPLRKIALPRAGEMNVDLNME